MSHFRLHTKTKETAYLKYLIVGLICLVVAVAVGYTIHSIGTARARSRETVLIFTEEEFKQYLVDQGSEEYNLSGSYRLEEDLDLRGLEHSIGTNLEPFTGSLDGNGHVIEGLERPLFGVMNGAKVENLFLGGAEIRKPFTYRGGEHYTDGYGALAAYVMGSEIRNCGMNGAIYTASPAEEEYLIARATSADAEEVGPGVDGPGSDGENPEESSPVMDGGDGTGMEHAGGAGGGTGDGDGTTGPVSGSDAGPGVETGEEGSLVETETSAEVGPGVETTAETTAGIITETTAETGVGGNENDGNAGTSAGNNGESHESDESNGSAVLPTDQEDGVGNEESAGNVETEASQPSNGSSDSVTETTGSGAGGSAGEPAGSTDAGAETSSGGKVDAPTEAGSELPGAAGDEASTGTDTGSSTGAGASAKPEISVEPGEDSLAEISVQAEKANHAAVEETIGFRFHERQTLRMKIPEVMDLDMEGVQTATPSDATPSDAQEGPGGDSSEDQNLEKTEETTGPEEPEYTENQNGDIYIRVTADRITAGGLVAEAAGETLIADSFALVTIDSDEKRTESYAGGMIGIVGNGSRLENSYAAGLADAAGVTGGFAAANDGRIQNSYSSVTIGKRGEIRGAFTAMGAGSLAGCVYDRQMACVEADATADIEWEEGNFGGEEATAATATEAEEAPEFTLRGLNTSQMTGLEAEVPGEWHLVDGAYPQLEYFAVSGQETSGASSRASAIALTLPDGVTLEDVLEEGAITVPGEVDGQQITWEADGDVQINGTHQVVIEPQARVSSRETVVVKSALVPEPAGEPQTEAVVQGQQESTDASPASGSLKASVGGATKQFMLSAVAPRAASTSYTTWDEVAAEVETGGSLAHLQPQAVNGYWEVGTPEALAWVAYKINTDGVTYATTKIKLTADIDLFGEDYSQKTYDPAANNIDDALKWKPIAGFKGELDGGGHEVHHMRVVVDTNIESGFFGQAKDGAVIKNFGIGSGKVTSSAANTGGLVGYLRSGTVTITNCWNRADVTGNGSTGGIAGYALNGYYTIEGCSNTGTITVTSSGGGGILGSTYMYYNDNFLTIKDCYNTGAVVSSDSAGGIMGYKMTANGYVTVTSCYNAGTVTGSSNIGSLVGNYSNNITSTNSYYLDTTVADVNARALTETQLKSWAAAFALNEQSMDGPWSFTAGEYPGFGVLASPADWSVIGMGGADGLVTAGMLTGTGDSGSPFIIRTAEQLATFAVMVNTKRYGAYNHASLESDIDLFGSQYTRFEGEHTIDNIEHALMWIPIGLSKYDSGSIHGYIGTFLGNKHEVDGMYVKNTPAGLGFSVGLFGKISKRHLVANISYLGIGPNSKVVACASGGSAGLLFGCVCNTSTGIVSNCYAMGVIEVMPGVSIRATGGFGDQWGPGKPDTIIQNCYSAVKGGVGFGGSGLPVKNCFGDATVHPGSGPGKGGVSTEELKSWAAAYVLNGYSMDGPWTYDPTGKEYPTWGTLPSARDWGDVGQAMYYKPDAEAILTGDGTKASPYQISTAEQLALFGYRVKRGETDKHAVLTGNISLIGAAYGDFGTSGPLSWRPIGDNDHVFNGSLNGKGKTLSYMNVRFDGYAGLFGCAGGGAEIRGIGLDPTCSVQAVETTPGSYNFDGTAAFVGAVKSDGTSHTQIQIKNCFNRGSVRGRTGAATGAFVGTHAGEKGVGGQRITNCYTSGALSTANGDQPGAIAGTFRSNPKDQSSGIRYCYWDGTTSGSVAGAVVDSGMVTIGDAQAFSSNDMTTSQAVLDLLNTEVETGAWSRTSDTNDNYPVYGETSSPVYNSWEDVGKYHLSPPYKYAYNPEGSGSSSNPFQLSTPEDLAWFAYQVNHGDTDICGELLADINLFGGTYTGNTYVEGDIGMTEKALPWIPAGVGTDLTIQDQVYQGIFQGNGHVVSLMNAQGGGVQGLFGSMNEYGKIFGTGIENSVISGKEAGGIIGMVGRDAQVNQCFVRQGTLVRTNGDTDAHAGGIVGSAIHMSRIQDCYMMEAEIRAQGTGNAAGGIVGWKTSGPEINSCYSEISQGGTIEGTSRGSIVGAMSSVDSDGNLNQCYSDAGFVEDLAVIEKLVVNSSDEETQAIVNALNVRGQAERTGTDRAWYTSLSTEPTKGYPTLVPPMTLTAAISPAQTSTGSRGSLDGALPEATYRGTRQEYGEGNPAFTLTGNTVVSGAFSTYGTDSANEKLGLVTGAGTDLAALAGSLANPTAAIGMMDALTLYNGAAYTCGKNRVIVIDVVSGGIRHEIRVTIQPAAEKTLNVVLPVRVGIEELTPNGLKQTKYSADLKLTNNNDYPIEGSITNLAPMTQDGYVTLKPVARNDPYGKTKQLTDPAGGVKIGVDNPAGGGVIPAGGIYYTPANDKVDPPVAEKWMEYQIKGNGILPYRYFMEYEANPHYYDTNQYGYTVNYQFGMSKEDIPAGVDAVTK